MRLRQSQIRLLAVAAAFLLASCASTPVDPQAALQRAASAMGATQLQSLQFSATGSGGIFGQAWRADDPWPKITYTSFSRHMDYANGAMREEFARTRAEPNCGGAVPLMGTGEQRANGYVRGDHAWILDRAGRCAWRVSVASARSPTARARCTCS